jgi:hypothetical protein
VLWSITRITWKGKTVVAKAAGKAGIVSRICFCCCCDIDWSCDVRKPTIPFIVSQESVGKLRHCRSAFPFQCGESDARQPGDY